VLASLAYHDYEGVALRDDEKPRLQRDLGMNNFLMLRNHGLLTVGPTIADTFLAMYVFETTCQIQISAQACGELVIIPDEVQSDIDKVMATGLAGMGGQIAWPAMLRKLDKIDTSYRD
jgi:ribulose-5-phosphate 4-epimerase/fuculose-1-phosphate aldolase